MAPAFPSWLFVKVPVAAVSWLTPVILKLPPLTFVVSGLNRPFAGRGGLSDAYNYAMKDLSNAIKSLSDKQKDILGYGGNVTFTGGETQFERISTKAPVYNGVLSNTNGSGGQPGLAYLNKDWGMTKKVDDYYLIQEGQKYAFEQMVAESWFLIEFNENALSKIDVDTISTNNFINNNQAWMRLDVLQSTP